MKNGITKEILIGMLLSVTCRVWAESPQLIVEGRNWNYEVEHHGPVYIGEAGDWHRSEYGFHFQGEEEIGGKVYSIFRNGEGEVVAYMREEGGKVYLKTWEESYGGWAFGCNFPGDESEVAIYDFQSFSWRERGACRI